MTRRLGAPGLHRVLDVEVLDARAERFRQAVLLLQISGEEPVTRYSEVRSVLMVTIKPSNGTIKPSNGPLLWYH